MQIRVPVQLELNSAAQNSCPKWHRAAEEIVMVLGEAPCPHPCPCTAGCALLRQEYLVFIPSVLKAAQRRLTAQLIYKEGAR